MKGGLAMSPKCLSIFSVLIVAHLIASCSIAPKQIAAYPINTPIARYPIDTTVVYRGYLELRVTNVELTADSSIRLVSDYGGYLVSSQSWYMDGRKITTLELAVPTTNFDSLRYALRRLGELVSETISGQPEEMSYYDPSGQWSYITLQLRPGRMVISVNETTGWNPLRTFQRAFSVFLTIFGYFADTLIWIIVVPGPFILMILVVLALVRRSRGKK